MAGFVLDASVYVAALVPVEAHHQTARALIALVPDDEPILVPSLFRLEVVAALARRRVPDHQLRAVEVALDTNRYLATPLDEAWLLAAVGVARRCALRAYDAVYAALALQRDATLLTLDEELRDRLVAGHPEVNVVLRP
ncbi:MAG: hypothetical protein A2138_23595 [Deltaproteobacteria bacterium RBG_16_71_12]|nr:MAG: hypothetical protein A2138_23595 [Deltaproteobacteria bacterium RBG_16_71_12]